MLAGILIVKLCRKSVGHYLGKFCDELGENKMCKPLNLWNCCCVQKALCTFEVFISITSLITQ